MSPATWRIRCGGGLVLLVVMLVASTVSGQPKGPAEPKNDVYHTAKFGGSTECVKCHTRQQGTDSEEFVLLTEYTTWRLSDRHSLAYAALEGPRGQEIGRLLGQDVTRAETGCLQCHSLHFPGRSYAREQETKLVKDGVSCEICHGPAEKWIGEHWRPGWRRKSPAEKFALGMYDVRDPHLQAKLCLSCHIGDAAEGKVVTHAMFAAGHPPLRSMEVASFDDRMPRHWRLLRDVPYLQKLAAAVRAEPNADDQKVLDSYHFGSAASARGRQVLASSLGCLRTDMALVAVRSRLPQKGAAAEGAARVWPELTLKPFAAYREDLPALWPQLAMGQADCYGCHHELRRASWRLERGYTGPPGRPQLLPWPATLARLGLGIPRVEQASLTDSLRALTAACNERPFGDPARLAEGAGRIRDQLGPIIDKDAATPVDRIGLLIVLCRLPENEYPDFDSARQVIAAFRVVYSEALRTPVKRLEPDPAIERLLAAWTERLDLGPDGDRAERQQRLIQTLAKLGKKKLPADPALLQALDQLTDHGYEEFRAGAGKKNAAILDALDRLLEALRSREGTELRDALARKDTDLLQDLQQLGDAQWQARAAKMRQYDPRALKKDLQKIAQALNAAGVPAP